MKAAELLQLYKDGKRDFRYVYLRGQNFTGQDLSGADFSEADIRSANFSNATLIGTNFSLTQAGTLNLWKTLLIILTHLSLGTFAAFTSTSAASFVNFLIEPTYSDSVFHGFIGVLSIITFCMIALSRGTLVAFGFGTFIFTMAFSRATPVLSIAATAIPFNVL